MRRFAGSLIAAVLAEFDDVSVKMVLRELIELTKNGLCTRHYPHVMRLVLQRLSPIFIA